MDATKDPTTEQKPADAAAPSIPAPATPESTPAPASTEPSTPTQPGQPVAVEPAVEPVPPKIESFLKQPHAQKPLSSDSHHTKSFMTKLLLLVIVVLFLIAGALAYIISSSKKDTQSAAQQNIQAVAPTTAPTAMPTVIPTIDMSAWQTYTGTGFTIKYPTDWKVKKENGVTQIYDPASLTDEVMNGGATQKVAKKLVSVSVITSTKTAKEVADEEVANWAKHNNTLTVEEIKVGGMSAEAYDNLGEEAEGKVVNISNGSHLATLTTKATDLAENSTENAVLKSFTFTSSLTPSVTETISPTATTTP